MIVDFMYLPYDVLDSGLVAGRARHSDRQTRLYYTRYCDTALYPGELLRRIALLNIFESLSTNETFKSFANTEGPLQS